MKKDTARIQAKRIADHWNLHFYIVGKTLTIYDRRTNTDGCETRKATEAELQLWDVLNCILNDDVRTR